MKKFTLVAAAAMMAIAAQAQYNVSPSTATVIEKGVQTVDYITLSDAAINDFTQAGARMNYVGPSPDEGRNLWYWENTFIPADESFPRVDFEEGGYISVEVTNQGWSGAGLAISDPGVNIAHFDENTIFHLAYMTPTNNGPASIALIILDESAKGSMPAKVALGASFSDQGAIYPSIGEKITDEWQGIEVSLGQLKRLYPSFDLQNKAAWTGNMLSWLGGGVQGQTMAFDAIYFYNTKSDGVQNIATDAAADFVVTANTINVAGANGIQLYNIAGQVVRSTEGTTLGLTGLAKGVYVAKAANKARKIVIR